MQHTTIHLRQRIMTHRAPLTILTRAVILVALMFGASNTNAQPGRTEQLLENRVRTYFAAMGKGDVATVGSALAPDYLVIGGDGKLETRAERLEWLRRNTSSLTAITPSEIRIRVYGTSSVATGLVTIPADVSGPAVEERFTQVWVQRDGAWRMVSGQITIVRKQ